MYYIGYVACDYKDVKLDISNVAAGVYALTIETKNEKVVRKIVIQ